MRAGHTEEVTYRQIVRGCPPGVGEGGPGRAVVLVIKEHDKDQGRRRKLMDEPAELSNGGSNPRSSASTELGQGITSEMVTGVASCAQGTGN